MIAMVHATKNDGFDADVIIAGAGPAGAATACHLARLGRSVILLDRAPFPRDKVCGDFVGPSALIELGELGVSQMDGYAQTNVGYRAAVHLDGEELISQRFPAIEGIPPYGRVIPRLILDKLVVDAARRSGARVMDGFPLADFAIDSSGVVVDVLGPSGHFTLRGRLLIGADGSSSTVARIMRASTPPRRDRIIAARAYFSDVEGPDDQLDLYFSSGCFPGYYWLFPTGKGEANVGLGMALETLPAHDKTPGAMLRRFLRDDPALATRLRNAKLRSKVVGWPLTTYNHGLSMIADRVMLIGDAAGLINPLNGEGIQYALLSARWASETLAHCLRDNDFSVQALAPFAARVERELRYDMALARLTVQIITNRSLTPVWLEALKIIVARARDDPKYASIAAGILAGLSPAREALSFKVVVGTVDQAVRSLSLKATEAAFSGSRGWVGLGIDAAQVGFQLAYDATMNPKGFRDWLMYTATCSIELGVQMSRDAVAGQPKKIAARGQLIIGRDRPYT